ncbi:hypothetical protein ACHHYP_00538 [Achlya hypogyna]|uniref:GRIP domain-containing protein n=1 Tax=Achlya hypogyna TaxID=1202772 RepID=A0A1V9ZUF2_ACHHY|nr:hypothetical protein ACHHYP_00538 [Achlya hypogyna]
MWGAITGQLATYAGELTNDLREIVAAGNDGSDGSTSPVEARSPRAHMTKAPGGVDDDLEEYVLDLERSLISKRQELATALKQNEAFKQQLQEAVNKAPPDDARLAALQEECATLRSELQAQKVLVEAKDADISRLNDQIAALVVKNESLDEMIAQQHAESTLAHALQAPSSTGSDDSLIQAMTVLSKVVPSTKLETETTSLSSSIVAYATAAASRVTTLEGDVKVLKNTLHAFLLSHHARLDATASLANWTTEAKAKLDQVTAKMVADADRSARLEQQVSQIQAKLMQTQTTLATHMHEHDALQEAHVVATTKLQELQAAASQMAEKDATIRSLQTKVKQLQRQNDQLQDHVDELTDQMTQLKRVVHTQESSLQEEMHEKEEAAMDRRAELERLVYSLSEELRETKEAYALEQAQWVEHAQANTSTLTEQQTFELTTQLTLLEADKNIAQQDAARLQSELEAAHSVFVSFQADRKREAQLYEATIATLRSQAAPPKDNADDTQRVLAALEKKQIECDRLREALDRTAQHLGEDVDNIDKRMAIQMMIQFHESPNKHDVLEVIARILGCTEEDKERLLGNPLRLQLRSLGRLFQTPTPEPPVDVAGKSFSDAWTEFLLDQVPADK